MPPHDTLAADLALAHELADAADALTMARFMAADLAVEMKHDSTPVTDADRAVERMVAERLARDRSGDALLGEEYGAAAPGTSEPRERRWIVDPVDGTKNFIAGIPVWATLLALESDGRIVVGVVSAPALRRRWWAARGLGCWTGSGPDHGRRCRVSAVARVEDAWLSFSDFAGWADAGRRDAFLGLVAAVARTRAYGDFWSHVLVAEGAVDISAEAGVSLWDVAALQVIVEEAGGVFSDLAGAPSPDRGSAVCANPVLHPLVLDRLGS